MSSRRGLTIRTVKIKIYGGDYETSQHQRVHGWADCFTHTIRCQVSYLALTLDKKKIKKKQVSELRHVSCF